MANVFENKSVLVTGGTGSIGSEVVRKLLQHDPRVVRILSNDENGQFNLQQELRDYSNVRFLIGDVRDQERLRRAIDGIDFVFHAAALKHVHLCEYNPFEAVRTNILGTQNIIQSAMDKDIEKVITISTDKVVNPINVLGATKLLAERLTISANYYKGLNRTAFSCVRFGNVLDSRGSVVPLFREQVIKGGPVTITDPYMTRFVMSISRAVDLVLKAAEIAHGGEIFIFKMPALRIGDLAEVIIEELAPKYGHTPASIKVEVTGKKAGEKDNEELLTEDEFMNARETQDMFIVNEVGNQKNKKLPSKRYTSEQGVLLTKEEIREMVRESLPQPL